MKLVLTPLFAAALATSAFAGASGGGYDQANKAKTTITKAEVKMPKISTRNASKDSLPYAYSNPLGVGPNNDSR